MDGDGRKDTDAIEPLAVPVSAEPVTPEKVTVAKPFPLRWKVSTVDHDPQEFDATWPDEAIEAFCKAIGVSRGNLSVSIHIEPVIHAAPDA